MVKHVILWKLKEEFRQRKNSRLKPESKKDWKVTGQIPGHDRNQSQY